MAAHSRWMRLTAVIALIGVALFLFGDRAVAIQDSEDKVWFGPVGITPGERALVNIYAVGNPDTIGDPDITPWNFVVRFRPARHARPGAVATARGWSHRFRRTCRPGRAERDN